MVVLSNQGKKSCCKVTLKRQPRNYAFVYWLVTRQQDAHGKLHPSSFRTLSGMIEAWQFRGLNRPFETRFGYELDQPYAFKAACMLSGQAIESPLDVYDSFFRKLTLNLILNFDRHETNTSPANQFNKMNSPL